MSPNVFDIVIIILLAFGAVNGFSKGLIISAAGLAALLLGVWGALKFSYILGNFLSAHTNFAEKTTTIISFIVTFILIVALINMVGKALQSLVESIDLGTWDKVFGIAFGILKSAFIISVLIAVINAYHPLKFAIRLEAKEKSIFYKPIASIAPKIFKQLDFKFGKLGIEEEEQEQQQPAGSQI
jgi:membrane protein required for colicin V production